MTDKCRKRICSGLHCTIPGIRCTPYKFSSSHFFLLEIVKSMVLQSFVIRCTPYKFSSINFFLEIAKRSTSPPINSHPLIVFLNGELVHIYGFVVISFLEISNLYAGFKLFLIHLLFSKLQNGANHFFQIHSVFLKLQNGAQRAKQTNIYRGQKG